MQPEYTFEKVASFSRRLGKWTEGRTCPLLVGLRSKEAKNNILACSKNLSGTPLNGVTIAPDLTRRQREADSKLREEAISRNSNLTAADRAKNLKWVAVGQKGARKLIKKKGEAEPTDHSHQPASQQQQPRRKRPAESTTAPTSRRPRVIEGSRASVASSEDTRVGDDEEEEEETEEETISMD